MPWLRQDCHSVLEPGLTEGARQGKPAGALTIERGRVAPTDFTCFSCSEMIGPARLCGSPGVYKSVDGGT